MKQEIMMWAVINNVTQEVAIYAHDKLSLHQRREDARFHCGHEKYHGNTAARVRKVKVTVEDAE